MIKLLAVDMDGTCLDARSRMTDRTLQALRKAAEKGVVIVPATGRNLECIPHRLAAGTLRRTGTPDDYANKGLFRYVISSNGARVTEAKDWGLPRMSGTVIFYRDVSSLRRGF